MAMIDSVVIVSCQLARLWMKGILFVRMTPCTVGVPLHPEPSSSWSPAEIVR
jgi:hypothetical protein